MNNINYATDAVEAQPHSALTMAAIALLRTGWQEATISDAEEPALLAQAGPFDVIGAVKCGAPPAFGKFSNCHPESRCVGCEHACSEEIALVDLAEKRQRPLLLFVAGTWDGRPSWLRVVVVAPGHSFSGQVFVPVLFRDSKGLTLVCEQSGRSLVASLNGVEATEISVGTPWVVAAFDRALSVFSALIPHDAQPELAALGARAISRSVAG